ncbi:MAG: TusE/DsrC/DsvC family sulfur relay protein [Buchnera aphidicola (Nurudea yanoniella)]
MNTYLEKNHLWNKKIAKEIAKKESIKITKDHWEIIYIIRNFYLKFNITPSMRILMKLIEKKKLKKMTSCYLFKLFPLGPNKQASKIAGIPKPFRCF